MNYKIKLAALSLAIGLVTYSQTEAQVADSIPGKMYIAGERPDRIILHPGENGETTIAVNWRTSSAVTESFLELAPATPGPEFQSEVKRFSASTSKFKTEKEDEPILTFNNHAVTVDQLTPGASYLYRVGKPGLWSEWFQIVMPDSKGEFSILYYGDAQTNILSLWSRVYRESHLSAGRVDVTLHAGDLINRHNSDLEWGEWFKGGAFLHASIPNLMSPGNHEFRNVKITEHWRAQFNLPSNGPAGVAELEETAYEVNYTDVKLISLDTEQIDESNEMLEIQKAWLRKILTENPKKWTFVFIHYPVYATKAERTNDKLLQDFRPIFEEFGVDMVLQGHDHAYARGQAHTMPGTEALDYKKGPVYVVSVAGPKMYDVKNEDWMVRKAFGTQLFQTIRINGDQLEYKSYMATGELYDAFVMTKKKGGNKIVNKIPAVPERTEPVNQ
ncbi:metallophosphoesterase family protein [Algoriphagus jejuensis]|uniref:Metallophosphoesterase family protein n=1 Tax=Algoriphagus jejuensis TaxID=419934 RepID=A0ABP3YKJ9_9BACT